MSQVVVVTSDMVRGDSTSSPGFGPTRRSRRLLLWAAVTATTIAILLLVPAQSPTQSSAFNSRVSGGIGTLAVNQAASIPLWVNVGAAPLFGSRTQSGSQPTPGLPPLDTVMRRIPVGPGPGTGELDSPDNAYVVPLEGCGVCLNGSVLIVSTLNYTILADIPVGDAPASPVVDPGSGAAYVVTLTDGVYVISVPLRTVVASFPVGWDPWPGAYDPFNGDIYIPAQINSSTDQGQVTVIAGTNHTVVATVLVGGDPYSAVVDPTTGSVYISNSATGNLSVIDPATNTVVAAIAVPGSPGIPTYDPANQFLYLPLQTNASGSNPRTIEVINTTTDLVTSEIRVASTPGAPAYDPATDELFVPCGSGSLRGVGNISVISGANNTVVATLRGGGYLPMTPTYVPSDGRLYLPDFESGNLTVIDGSSNTVVARVPIHSGSGLAYDPAHNLLYATDYWDGQVLVLGAAAAPNVTWPIVNYLLLGFGVSGISLLAAAILRCRQGKKEWRPNRGDTEALGSVNAPTLTAAGGCPCQH